MYGVPTFWNTARYSLVTTKTYRKCVTTPRNLLKYPAVFEEKTYPGQKPTPNGLETAELGVSTISDVQKSGAAAFASEAQKQNAWGSLNLVVAEFMIFVNALKTMKAANEVRLLGSRDFGKCLFWGCEFWSDLGGSKDPWSYPQLGRSAQMVECLMRSFTNSFGVKKGAEVVAEFWKSSVLVTAASCSIFFWKNKTLQWHIFVSNIQLQPLGFHRRGAGGFPRKLVGKSPKSVVRTPGDVTSKLIRMDPVVPPMDGSKVGIMG